MLVKFVIDIFISTTKRGLEFKCAAALRDSTQPIVKRQDWLRCKSLYKSVSILIMRGRGSVPDRDARRLYFDVQLSLPSLSPPLLDIEEQENKSKLERFILDISASVNHQKQKKIFCHAFIYIKF